MNGFFMVNGVTRLQHWVLLAREARFEVATLTRLCHASERQVERYFQRNFGRTPQNWLAEQRMVDARMLLLETESVKCAALHLGFKQESHFCREFKRVNGMTPTKFLLRAQRANREFILHNRAMQH
jgi:AraC-like DNA-binding protein